MQFTQSTILGFFDSSQKQFIIPVYQRAYSWEKKEWDTFLTDLKEQIEGDNNYFFGNILLETIKKDRIYEIIDGQQRLTTLVIFIRALINVFQERKQQGEDIEIDLDSKFSIYLKNNGNIKLRPVDYDRACFDSLIIENNADFNVNSISQKRIKNAKDFFINELRKEKTDSILNILEETELTIIELKGKKDSALMFELQNNRGKDLTNMEKLKSYFMYQMYVYSPIEETETNIEYISNIFKNIYLIIKDLRELDEDSILTYHCYAYIKGYAYRTIADIKETFKKIGKEEKVEWIKKFVDELHNSFSNLKKFEQTDLSYANDLKKMKIPAFVYPFIIKGYKYFGNSDEKLNRLFNILEILVFRYKLINSRADINSRLNDILKNFEGKLDKLAQDLKNKMNESWYWGDQRISDYLNDWMYDNRVLHYLLWKYEEFIQIKQIKGYSIKKLKLINEQIEHISPQTPTDGSPLASGYEINNDGNYDDEFKKSYLNCLGNLMLISGSHNSSIGNKPFKEKLNSYLKNPLLNQQVEIQDFIEGDKNNPKWTKNSIIKRKNKIVNFAINKWSFDNCG